MPEQRARKALNKAVLRLDGALGILARPLESDHDAPWSAVRLLLRGGLTDGPGLPGARYDPRPLAGCHDSAPPPRTWQANLESSAIFGRSGEFR